MMYFLLKNGDIPAIAMLAYQRVPKRGVVNHQLLYSQTNPRNLTNGRTHESFTDPEKNLSIYLEVQDTVGNWLVM